MKLDRAQSHPLKDYSLAACLDWIAVRVRFSERTQFQKIQARMVATGYRAQFVTMVDPWTAETRIQDPPQDPAAFMALMQKLVPPEAKPVVPDDVQILGVEIALDFTPKTPQALAGLDSATAYLMRYHAHPEKGVPRITRKGPGEKAFEAAVWMPPRQIEREFAAGWSINVGEQGDSRRNRYYTKRRDSTLTAAYAPLPTKKHCARLEVTLTGADCPFQSVSEWAVFRFETLLPAFAMVRERTAPATPMRVAMRARMTQFGRHIDQTKAAAHRRTSWIFTRRDSVLNKRIARALAKLTSAEICHESEGAGAGLPLEKDTGADRCPKYLNGVTPTQPQQQSPNPAPFPKARCWTLPHRRFRHHGQQQAPPSQRTLHPLWQKPKYLKPLPEFFSSFPQMNNNKNHDFPLYPDDCLDFGDVDGNPTDADHEYFVKLLAVATAKAAQDTATLEALSKAKKSVSVTLRISGPVLAAFKRQAPKHGLGYQTLINRVLKDAARSWSH